MVVAKVVAIGSDHAGVELKREIMACLQQMGVQAVDLGPEGTASVDYPDYARKVAELVASGQAEMGILICGTGIGMSIAANKCHGIRAALCSEPVSARLSRQHNNANVLAMGSRMIGPVMAAEIVRTWLETPFDGGRHAARLSKITFMEEVFSKNAGQK